MIFASTIVEAIPFNESLPQTILDIDDKNRSNLFAWRGQFSPQLIEGLLKAYCPKNGVVLDPFCGSGTTLYESGKFGLQAYGFELNPAAWILSRVYQFINKDGLQRKITIDSVYQKLLKPFPPFSLLNNSDELQIPLDDFSTVIKSILEEVTEDEKIFLEALVILLDLYDNQLTSKIIYDIVNKLSKLVKQLPRSDVVVTAGLADTRSLPLANETVDFIVTSPPYINVFNYHQNYRRSAEALGWDLLDVARSEIGSNRANRGNRFLTVIQYCIDMATTLNEINRVCKPSGKFIMVVGHESNVLGVPFYNANIIENIALRVNTFSLVQRQKRKFTNRFGKVIWEDLLHFVPRNDGLRDDLVCKSAKEIAKQALVDGQSVVPEKNREALFEAIEKVDCVSGTPIFESNKRVLDK